MKLLRLTLENWRAITDARLQFADEVTLVEGPNEVGKSTLMEALRTLFEELDSSNKKSVKAIQPVGRDVASRVEAEVECGEYHFVFSKTYNRDRATTLQILAPTATQLTGREAHQKVADILSANVDMALWHALTIEQGQGLAAVGLAESAGLSAALDEAAGGGSGEPEDGDLYAAARAEYERYFTPKTGRPRQDERTAAVETLRDRIAVARAALAASERDGDDLRRCAAEIQRLEQGLPDLRGNLDRLQERWQDLQARKQAVAGKRTELEATQAALRLEQEEHARRERLRKDRDASRAAEGKARDQLPRLQQVVESCAEQVEQLQQRYQAQLEQQQRGQAELVKSREQESLLQRQQQLAGIAERLQRGTDCQQQVLAQRRRLAGARVNAPALEKLREAERQLQLAVGQRDIASAVVAISAEAPLDLELNEEATRLPAGEAMERQLSASMRLRIPGVTSITLTPPNSAAELEAAVAARRGELQQLLDQFEVNDLAAAIAAHARRQEAQQELQRWQAKLDELLQGESLSGLGEALTEQQAEYDRLLALHGAAPGPGEATELRKAQETALAEVAATLADLQSQQVSARERLHDARATLALADGEARGHGETVRWLTTQLAEARGGDDGSSDELDARAKVLEAELLRLAQGLDEESTGTARTLLDNATASLARAESELQQQRQASAVLTDRLERARADGEFERLQEAERELAELEGALEQQQQRAAAAECLWQTLNRHRDQTRRAYARPLREGIEQLGRIVFGADFTVELGEDWKILTCTREGRTIPFDDLRVGMREQLGILTRLAAARLTSGRGGAPLIIDDALGFSDPERLQTMGAAIAAAARDTQIILLTCFPGRFTHVGNARRIQL